MMYHVFEVYERVWGLMELFCTWLCWCFHKCMHLSELMSNAQMADFILNYSSTEKKKNFLVKVCGGHMLVPIIFIHCVNQLNLLEKVIFKTPPWFTIFLRLESAVNVTKGAFHVLAPALPTYSELPLLLLSQGPSSIVVVHGPVFHWTESCLSIIHPV